TFQLYGPGAQLNEVFPGGFRSTVADNVPPHRYANTDLFPNDPDHFDETVDHVSAADDLTRLLLQQYIVPQTNIQLDLDQIEVPATAAPVTSLKFRGEETARAIIRDLAIRAGNAAWGVDESGTFFFLNSKTTLLDTWQEGSSLLALEELRDRSLLYNRIVLTGDYVYDETVNSDVTARGFYRWRGNYVQPASRTAYGERRIRLWVPWIRTRSDSRQFTQEFFRVYAQPAARYTVEVAGRSVLPRPWAGQLRLLDRDGTPLITAQPESVRVQFDHVPTFRVELGPPDPQELWAEPPHDERWEIPGAAAADHGGDILTFPPPESSTGEGTFSSASWFSSDSSILSDSQVSDSFLSDSSSSAALSSSAVSDSGSGAESSAPDSEPGGSGSPASEDSSDGGLFSSATSGVGGGSASGTPGGSSDGCLLEGFGPLLLCLQAESITALSDGDPVITWPDDSGSAHDATQSSPAARPVWKDSASSGHGVPVVRFASDWMEIDGLHDELSGDDVPYTLLAVMGTISDANGHVLHLGHSDGMSQQEIQHPVRSPFIRHPDSGSRVVGSQPNSASGRHVYCWRFTGSQVEYFRDGTALGSTAVSVGSLTLNQTTLGAWRQATTSASQPLQADVLCVAVFGAALNSTDRTAAENALKIRYGIS
ncbi:MAG: hypothetical protein KDA79_03790, partial [Planctomycetaceae bacterium]|nr:hypothetical protein [Planctomycetaceae bacterium]